MIEPSFLGISKSAWDMINGFANWFAALGSLAAAVVALYIANRAAKPTARVSVTQNLIVASGSSPPYPEFARFRIVNTGDRPIRITQLGWKWGVFRKRYAIQMHEHPLSSGLPVELSHGQEANWYIPFSVGPEPWPEYFAKKALLPRYRIALWTLRGQFYSSVGYVFEARPEATLLNYLRAACEKISRQRH